MFKKVLLSMAAVAMTVTLSSCAGSVFTPAPEPTTKSGAPLGDQLGDAAIHSGYVLLPDGREVMCVANNFRGSSGGVTCDWDNAREPNPEN